jgi:hypothetical protein
VTNATIRPARHGDVERMAELADAKREQYRDNAAPFQRPAAHARAIHTPFLNDLIGVAQFVVLVHESGGDVDGFLVGRIGGAPPPLAGRGDVFYVDDFAVAAPSIWPTAGRELLTDAGRRARALGASLLVVVSGPGVVDAPKVELLTGIGLALEAEWWVKPIEPRAGEPAAPIGFEAFIGPAPPVYDPGGPVCMALRVAAAGPLEELERFAAYSGAVVVIVPVEVARKELRANLARRGYVVASEWYAGPVASATPSG